MHSKQYSSSKQLNCDIPETPVSPLSSPAFAACPVPSRLTRSGPLRPVARPAGGSNCQAARAPVTF